MNQDDFMEAMKDSMRLKAMVLEGLHTLPVVHLHDRAELKKWIEGELQMAAIRWFCDKCDSEHAGMVAPMYAYKDSLRKFGIVGLDLTGSMITLGFKRMSDLLTHDTFSLYIITADGKMKEIHQRHHRYIYGGYPMTEGNKVDAMFAGLTPEQLGRESWDV